VSPLDAPAPPRGEEIHLPGPSYVPIVNAIGVTLALVGLIISKYIIIAGILIFLGSLYRWIGDTRRDIADLPLDHTAGH
jgi:hypothetical protein